MEEINIIPGSYGEALKNFLQQKEISVSQDRENFRLAGEKAQIASALGAFLEDACLYEEAQRMLQDLPPALRNEAAKRAVSCTHQDVAKEISEHLTESNTLHLEGFVRFRMKSAMEEVRYLARLCAEELVQEERYRDFLMLLQTYVKECEPLVDTVLLLADGAGQHHLFTENGVEITYDYADLEDAESLENEDDVILSSLITIAPRTVYLYGQDRSANPCLVDTIRKIFSVREIC